MSIFKKKLRDLDKPELPVEPIELYQSLFHKEGFAYLRGIQEEVLNIWHGQRDAKDVVCKMNTGSGKTLTGLLMLYSKIAEGTGNSVYLCPDKQLVEQTVLLAEMYGFPVCQVDDKNQFPSKFLNQENILICTFQRLFNGRSIFYRDRIEIGSILIDDAHACVDKSRENTTITLDSDHDLAQRLLALFKESLKYQASGTYNRILEADPYASVMKVPYWIWMEKIEEVIGIIGEYAEEDEIKFKWNLINDDLTAFDCYFGPRGMAIAPIHVPYHNVQSFHEAKHRFVLSATFEDNADLLVDLGIAKASIGKPIIPSDRKDVGQRLILAPARFDPEITREQNLELVKSYVDDDYNVVVLVPSSQRAKSWEEIGATIITKENIKDTLRTLKESTGNFCVLVNRYDGVDLPGNMCRILVLDGYPLYSSLKNQYTEVRLEYLQAAKKAQLIEQGIGRAVRSGSDYCVVFLMGTELLRFFGNSQNMRYLTPVTKRQVEIGLSLLDGEAKDNSIETIKETAKGCLDQDEDWREYHSGILRDVDQDEESELKIRRLEIAEREAESLALFRLRDYEAAAKIILTNIVEKLELSHKERGWYFQFAAQMLFLHNRPAANDLQVKAIKTSTRMFQPQDGMYYMKISARGAQPALVLKKIKDFSRPQDLKIYVEQIISELQFNPDVSADRFENALADLGNLIGFRAQQPEKEIGNGPDVLWCQTDSHYLILEAKSRTKHPEISRDDIGQLLQSTEWFKKVYGDDIEYTPVTLQPPNVKGDSVNPSDKMMVMDQGCLDLLIDNLRQFGNALSAKATNAHTEDEISKLLISHHFTSSEFRGKYLSRIK